MFLLSEPRPRWMAVDRVSQFPGKSDMLGGDKVAPLLVHRQFQWLVQQFEMLF